MVNTDPGGIDSSIIPDAAPNEKGAFFVSEIDDFFDELVDFHWDGRGQSIMFPGFSLPEIDRVTKNCFDVYAVRPICGYTRTVDGPDIFYEIKAGKWGRLGYIKLSGVTSDFTLFYLSPYYMDSDAWWGNLSTRWAISSPQIFRKGAIAHRAEVMRRLFMFMKKDVLWWLKGESPPAWGDFGKHPRVIARRREILRLREDIMDDKLTDHHLAERFGVSVDTIQKDRRALGIIFRELFYR